MEGMMRNAAALAFAVVIATPAMAIAQSPTTPRSSQPSSPEARADDDNLKIPQGERWLGTVRIPADVLADGKPLPAGTYRVRLTGKHADSVVVGQRAELERWVEFVSGGTVRGRAMAPVVPAPVVDQVAEKAPPAQGRFRVERLRGDEYIRLWYNLNRDQILIHLPRQAAVPARSQ
jgi:hypothetical protein